MQRREQPQWGGAAIEYIVVSIFATTIAFGSIAFVGRILKEKIQTLQERLGVTMTSEEESLFDLED